MAHRAVWRAPKSAARGLGEWAIDLWPYVNGKALTLGLKLSEMDMSEMLDVIHFFFEEDSRYVSGEEAEAVSKLRTSVYESMYGVRYPYKVQSSGSGTMGNGRRYISPDANFDLEDIPTNQSKPYVPPTDFNPDAHLPFGDALEAPLG